ncbi:Leucine-rich repeat-containing protein 40 [Fibrella aestuarina BUZ 2]|uniref:Leucine-rich repeat-containing protein 40 n=1 Tax=Fibrella aestuarina BUZ 2 TaxID=1166018 RepID=I0KCD2_9BACT|nr:leucine-rich repeat domain-containing protein [Fibrella aestuarina]CCH01785.1 Leucine-rich repeat-containing protein 40 [Fibrella aestuarina BUZ 2]
MVRALLFTLLLAGSRLTFAQQTVSAGAPPASPTRVILWADSAAHNISPAELMRTYAPIETKVDALPPAKRKEVTDALMEHSNEKNTAVESQGSQPADGFFYNVTELFAANGRADWIIISPMGEPNRKALDELLRRLTVFYQTDRYAKPMASPYSNEYFTNFGRPREKRAVRTGDSTISTLEAAAATTRPDTVKYVYFNQLDLKNVPDVVYRFPNLEELDLSKNGLVKLPARLTADLPQLRRLSVLFNQIGNDSVFITPNKHLLALTLQGNKLTRIPTSVRNARNLESLWMGNNKLAELNVKAIKRLKHLYDLNLYNAGLTSLPKQIRKLKHVRVLDLYYNELTTLPKQIGNMRRLEQLAVAHNKLTSLPPQLARLRRLDTLYAHHNPLATLPTAFNRFKAIRLLDLSYNRLSAFPDQLVDLKTLESVDLSGNNIQVLPTSVTQLSSLKHLFLRSNPVTRDDAKIGPYAKVIDQLEAQNTAVYY